MTKVDGDNNGDNADSKTQEVAIKVFPEAERKSWETELELYRLPRIKHPNILHFIGIDKVKIFFNSYLIEKLSFMNLHQ